MTDYLDFISAITERSQIQIFIESDAGVPHSLVALNCYQILSV